MVPQCGSNRLGDRVFKSGSFEIFTQIKYGPEPEILQDAVNCSCHDSEGRWIRHTFLYPKTSDDLWSWMVRVVGEERLKKIENKLHVFQLTQLLRELIDERGPSTGLDLNVYLLN